MVLATFLCVRLQTSSVGLDGRYRRLSQQIFQSGMPLTITTPLERIWPVGVADNVLPELRASLDLGLQQITLVEEQDDCGIRQQFIRND